MSGVLIDLAASSAPYRIVHMRKGWDRKGNNLTFPLPTYSILIMAHEHV